MEQNSKSPRGVNSPLYADVIEAIRAVIDRDDLGRVEKLVLVGIVFHGLDASEPGNRRLMRYASIRKEETVSKALRRLGDRGLIAKRERSGRLNQFRTAPDIIKGVSV